MIKKDQLRMIKKDQLRMIKKDQLRVIKKGSVEKNPSALAKIRSYEEKFRILP